MRSAPAVAREEFITEAAKCSSVVHVVPRGQQLNLKINRVGPIDSLR